MKGGQVLIKNALFSNAKLVTGNSKLPLGWCSNAFNTKIKNYNVKNRVKFTKRLENRNCNKL